MRSLLKSVALILATTLTVISIDRWLHTSDASTDRPQVAVIIPDGSSAHRIAQLLQQQGVLSSTFVFRLWLKLTGQGRQLKPGEYLFTQPMAARKVIDILVNERVITYPVTFPEGFTLQDIERTLRAKHLVEASDWHEAIRDVALMKQLSVPGPSFEGFLFPDTYRFSKNLGARRIVATMVRRCLDQITPLDQQKAQHLGLTLLEWITLASIIEKESSRASEHTIISSVFHNRLQRNMRLQSDPTVIYGIKNFDGNIRKIDLQTPTAFNTYTIQGLPPHPIASPSASAIRSAVNPAQTDYLFFVSKGDGEHVFSQTYAQHRQAVKKYQLKQR